MIKDKLYKFKNIVIVELLYMLILQIFGAYIYDLSIGQATKKGLWIYFMNTIKLGKVGKHTL